MKKDYDSDGGKPVETTMEMINLVVIFSRTPKAVENIV